MSSGVISQDDRFLFVHKTNPIFRTVRGIAPILLFHIKDNEAPFEKEIELRSDL